MKFLYVIPALAVLGLSVYADGEEDVLQTWIDYVDEYRQYMEEYRQWASDRFGYYENQISELTSQLDEKSQYVQELEETIDRKNKFINLQEERIENLVEELEEDSINHISNEPETTSSNGRVGDNSPASTLPDQASVSNATAEVQFAVGSIDPACADADECFIPSEVTVDVGGEVTWTNVDNVLHTIAAGDLSEDPSMIGTDYPNGFGDAGTLIQPGETFSHTFLAEGTYPYVCTVHPWMAGTVVVGGGNDRHREVKTQLQIDDIQTNTPTESKWQEGGYITTDKHTYTADDTIHITGNIDPSEIPDRRNLRGETIPPHEHKLGVWISNVSGITCTIKTTHGHNSCSSGFGHDSILGGLSPPSLDKFNDDDNTFSFKARVGDNTKAGVYTVTMKYTVDGISIHDAQSRFTVVPSNQDS